MLSYTLNDGNTIPWIAFGTGTALYKQDASKAVTTAIENGITHLDGAQMYDNEQSLGEGIKASKKPRSELFITTKLERVLEGKTIKEKLVESLKKLDITYVDLFLIHDPTPTNQQPGGLKAHWKQMEEIKKEGLAKSIGVSNFRISDLEEILDGASIPPAVNQIEFHPYIYAAASPIYKYCKDKNILVASYSGLTPLVHAPGGPVDPVISNIATRLQNESGAPVSHTQVLVKWLVQQGILVVTTTSKPFRIAELLAAPALPDLTDEEFAAIETEGAKVHKRVWMNHIFEE